MGYGRSATAGHTAQKHHHRSGRGTQPGCARAVHARVRTSLPSRGCDLSMMSRPHRLYRPYFHYADTPDRAWSYTTWRLRLLPGAGALPGGSVTMPYVAELC